MIKGNEIKFAERINQCRKKHRMTQKELATKLSIGNTMLSDYENGKFPSIKALIKISDFFAKSSDYMVGLTENSLSINREYLQLPLSATKAHHNLVLRVHDEILKFYEYGNDEPDSFAIKLQMLRVRYNVSQYALGNKLAISNSALSSYELGRNMPCIDFLHGLALFFDVSLDYLIGLTEIPFSIHDNKNKSFLIPLKSNTTSYQKFLLEKFIVSLF